jgi:hypothetical protein
MTWKFVTTRPLASTTTPEPSEFCARPHLPAKELLEEGIPCKGRGGFARLLGRIDVNDGRRSLLHQRREGQLDLLAAEGDAAIRPRGRAGAFRPAQQVGQHVAQPLAFLSYGHSGGHCGGCEQPHAEKNQTNSGGTHANPSVWVNGCHFHEECAK